jgi:hypothetical protein
MSALLIKRIRVYAHEAVYRLPLPPIGTEEHDLTISAIVELKRKHGVVPGAFSDGVWYHVIDEAEEVAKIELVRLAGSSIPPTFPVEVTSFEAFCQHEHLNVDDYLPK